MPTRDWYDVPLKSKLSSHDGFRHVAIPTASIRVAAMPPRPDAGVPIDEYLFDRDDYLRLSEQLLRRGVVLHVYGSFGNLLAEASYRALADHSDARLQFAGTVNRDDFATELSQYDAALLSGFVPYQPVPRSGHAFESPMFDTLLAARLPLFVAAGTWGWGEREIGASGAGFIFESIDALVEQLHDEGALARASNAAHSLQDCRCEPAGVAERDQNRFSSTAA